MMILLYKHILVAVDGSGPSIRALTHASVLAEKFGARLTILTAFVKPSIPLVPIDEEVEDEGFILDEELYSEYWDHVKEAFSKILHDAENYVKKNASNVDVEGVLIDGKASAAIINHATKINADLIVMGNSGIGGIKGWLLGSTSKRVVDTCKRPILIVK